jgi:pimeloyl-ACP methyl ester carboxylesterase
MRSSVAALIVALALAGLAGSGCAKASTFTTVERYDRGLVVCLSGAGGMTGECSRLRQGLDSGGVNRAIEIFEWSSGKVLTDQTDIHYNHRKAAELAAHLEQYMAGHPGRPVTLVGLSAGTGVAVWALEDLSAGYRVDGAILLASSLERHYDLTLALGNVRHHLYSFNSLADAVLGVGVSVIGPVDREGVLAGGFSGFVVPDGASETVQSLYRDKLVQIAWTPLDIAYGHMGDHLGATSTLFVKNRLAPLVMGRSVAAEKPAPPVVASHPVEKPAPSATVVEAPTPVPPAVVQPVTVAKPATTTKSASEKSDGRFFGWTVGQTAVRRSLAPEDVTKPTTEGLPEASPLFKDKGPLP